MSTHGNVTFAIKKEFLDDLKALSYEKSVNMHNTYARMIVMDFIKAERKRRGLKTIVGGEPIE